MQNYTFSVADDFTNNKVDLDKLRIQILQSNIAKRLLYMKADEGNCEIIFEESLDGSEVTTLNSVVSGHDGVALDEYETFDEYAYIEDDTVGSTTSITYIDRISLGVSHIYPGRYRIGWYFEWAFATTTTYSMFVTIILNDADAITEYKLQPFRTYSQGVWYPVMGFKTILLADPYEDAGDLKISIHFKTSNATYAAYIRNAKIEIETKGIGSCGNYDYTDPTPIIKEITPIELTPISL